jgi:hypothetical protein
MDAGRGANEGGRDTMDMFWGVLFGVIAGVVLAWLLRRVIMAGRELPSQPFSGSEPVLPPEELDEHRAVWDRSKEEGDPY